MSQIDNSKEDGPEATTVYRTRPCTLTLSELEALRRRIDKPENLDDALLAVAVENAGPAMARKIDAQLFACLFQTNR